MRRTPVAAALAAALATACATDDDRADPACLAKCDHIGEAHRQSVAVRRELNTRPEGSYELLPP